jgi:hypothetical protein
MMSVQNEKWEFHDSALSCPHGDWGDPLREEGSSADIKKSSLYWLFAFRLIFIVPVPYGNRWIVNVKSCQEHCFCKQILVGTVVDILLDPDQNRIPFVSVDLVFVFIRCQDPSPWRSKCNHNYQNYRIVIFRKDYPVRYPHAVGVHSGFLNSTGTIIGEKFVEVNIFFLIKNVLSHVKCNSGLEHCF